ncbi:MAG: 3D domain-containing protein [Oscillospiraceae bacterium]|nr:3D domain-containing protein [Oscillospiraceae bacterium]
MINKIKSFFTKKSGAELRRKATAAVLATGLTVTAVAGVVPLKAGAEQAIPSAAVSESPSVISGPVAETIFANSVENPDSGEDPYRRSSPQAVSLENGGPEDLKTYLLLTNPEEWGGIPLKDQILFLKSLNKLGSSISAIPEFLGSVQSTDEGIGEDSVSDEKQNGGTEQASEETTTEAPVTAPAAQKAKTEQTTQKPKSEPKKTAPAATKAATAPAATVPATTAAAPQIEKPADANAASKEAPTAAPETTKQAEETTKAESALKQIKVREGAKPMSKKAVPASVEIGDDHVPANYKKVIEGVATAYSNDPITSTGTKPIVGTIAVNPKIIPYGTKMWIVSMDGKYVYGYAVAEDTGGFTKWKNAPIADLYMNSNAECKAFGRRSVRIYVLS